MKMWWSRCIAERSECGVVFVLALLVLGQARPVRAQHD